MLSSAPGIFGSGPVAVSGSCLEAAAGSRKKTVAPRRVLQSARDSAISRTLFEPHCAFRAVFSTPRWGSAQFLRFSHHKALTNLTFVRLQR